VEKGGPWNTAPMDRVKIRSAVPSDVVPLVALLEHGALEEENEESSDLNAYSEALAAIQASGTSDVLVAELDGAVVGMCQVLMLRHFQRRGGLCAEVESMHVHPVLPGRGIGERLLDAVVDTARQAGCYWVQLTSNLLRTEAHRFYERHGFVPSHVGFKRLLETP
jgi:GNAT superfamily N-acetyltransferase